MQRETKKEEIQCFSEFAEENRAEKISVLHKKLALFLGYMIIVKGHSGCHMTNGNALLL